MSDDVVFSADLRANLAAMKSLRDVEVLVGTDLTDPPYPWFLEFGTSRMPAYPSARPAYEESKDAAQAAAAGVLRSQFAKEQFTQATVRAAGDVLGLTVANRWKQIAQGHVDTGTYWKSIHVETEDA